MPDPRHTPIVAAALVALGCAGGEQPPRTPASSSDAGRRGPEIHALPEGCGPQGKRFSCNPLTNAGCNAAADEACDDDDHGAFACFAGSDDVAEGGACDDDRGPACGAGMTCDAASGSRGTCRKFCCTNADCATPKKCAPLEASFGALGVCR